MDPAFDDLPLDSRMCLSCAMCCDGTLFDVAVLGEGEQGDAKRLGMQPATSPDGRGAFQLPCPCLAGKACIQYASWRPATCGNFTCTLQVKAKVGEIPEDKAFEMIRLALRARDAVLSLLPQGEDLSSARERFEVLAASQQPLAGPDARFVVQMFALERMLDQHFRKQGKGRLPAAATPATASSAEDGEPQP